MTNNDQQDAGSVLGSSLSAAVDAVVAADETRDPEAVRDVLETVSEDGTVTGEALDEARSDAAQVLATAETRTELAGEALADAEAVADEAPDLAIVEERIDTYERQLTEIEDRVDRLGDDLQEGVSDDGSALSVFEAAQTLRQVDREARDAQQAADELQVDLEEFEHWATDHDVRVDSVRADLNVIAETVEELQGAALAVKDAVDDDAEPDRDVERPDLLWADTLLRHAVIDLLCDDVRAEVAELRTWARHEDRGEDWADTADERIENAEEGLAAVQHRLDTVTQDSWVDRHGDRLDEFGRTLDDAGLPVDWTDIQAQLQKHRQELQNEN
jgi:chromosome segregation ATPase